MRGMSKKDALACQVSLGLFAGLLGIASTAHGAPIYDGGTIKGDSVKAGHVTLNDPKNATSIISDTENNVIGWKDFSIKDGETVQFDAHSYLNIVTGNVTSHIDGTMTGGNNVYIANTHGVVFGEGASVDVGNLYVTTQDLTGVDYSQPANSSKIGNGTVIDTSTGKAAASAKADVVSLVDTSGKNLKAAKIVLEGRSVRIMNDANIQSSEVYTLANTDPLVEPNGTKTVRPYTGYVHVGYAGSSVPTSGGTGRYRNLSADNMYQLVGSAPGSAPTTDLSDMTSKSGNYMLRSDIALTSTHTPIGTSADPFKGRFDGMFHEITGLTLGTSTPGTSTEYVGLFGTTDGATIMNVGLKNADLSHVQYGGGLVGHAKRNTVISAVYNESTTSIGAGSHAGGLIGWLDSSSLDNAYNTTNVSQGGGLVGQFDGTSKIYAVYNSGTLSGGTYGVFRVLGGGAVSNTAFVKEAYTTNGSVNPSMNNDYIHNSYAIGSAGMASLVMSSGTPVESDAKQAATYAGWDISDEGGANQTWRIFAGQTTPLLTAFMKGTVQAEYSYAYFQQANHGHSDNIASGYTVQAEDKTNGSYVKRPGTESNGGKDITKRTYNADYLKIAHKDGDNYTPVTSVDPTNDHDIKLYGAKDRSLVELSKADSQGKGGDGGRRNAGREAMLISGQHGYDIAGANLHIEKRKVIGDVGQMGKIEREYDGTANAGDAFKAALTAGNVVVRTDGLVDGDGATMTINTDGVTFREKGNWTSGAALSPNAGYNKSIYVDSSKVHFGNADGNYEFDATKINDKNLTGNILQKTIKAKLTTDTGINKTYDGTSAVIGAAYQPNPNLVLDSATSLVASGDVELNRADVTAKYKTKATNKEATNAGAHDVAYEGVKLQNTSDPAKTKNYKLVDKDGTVLYREAIDDDPNAAVTSGTLWGTGDIKKRKIDASAFTVSGGDKIYDGTEYLVVDGTTRKVQGTVDTAAGKAGDTGKNVADADKNKLKFTISADGNKAYYKNSATSATTTTDVYDATTNPNGARVLSYTLKASDTTNGETLANYELDYSSSGGTTCALNTTGTYNATGEGKITPRDITVDLLKKTGIDKTYDGNADVLAADKTFGTNFGYIADATDEHKLVAGDGASITATAAVYKKASGLETADKDVSRTGGTPTGTVIEDGKDVEYKVGLAGANAATNYRLKYGTSTTNGGASDTVKMTGTGTITPKKLTLNAPAGIVTREYDATANVYANQLPASYTSLGAANGVLSGDTVNLSFGSGNPVVGKYYTDSTTTTEVSDANASTASGNPLLSGKQLYTVKYTTTPTLDNGNYAVDATTPPTGQGKITQLTLTNTNFEMDFGDREKVFDGTKSANIGNDLTKLRVKNGAGNTMVDFLTKPVGAYEITGEYDNTHANLGRGAVGSRNLLTGKSKYHVTYKVKFQDQDLSNYDFSSLSGDYVWDAPSQTISRTKQVGYIRQKEVIASLNYPKVSKVYNGLTNVLDGDGEKIGPGAGVTLNGLALRSGGTYGANASDGEYDNKNVQATPHAVTYALKVEGSDTYGTYANDYYFVANAGGPSITQLVGEGEIKARPIDVEFFDANRQYDGTTAVDRGAASWGYRLKARAGDPQKDKDLVEQLLSNNAADPAHDKPAGENLQGDPTKFDVTQITGNYVDEDGTPQGDVGTYTDRVKYQGIKDALLDGNYTIKNIKMGSGRIDKRQIQASDLNLDISAATKVYDGTTAVKKAGGKAEDYITSLTMNLGGTIGQKTYTKNSDYSLDSAVYANPNVSANTAGAAGTGGSVTYTISLKKSDGTESGLLKNYDLTNLPAGYAFNSTNGTLSRTVTNGTITKRPVYALANGNVSKIYNGKTNVLGASNNVLTGKDLVTFGDKLENGTVIEDAGLIEADKERNATKAAYRDKTAGTGNKIVDYKLSIDPNAAISDNYALYDGRTGTAVAPDASGNYVISTTTNTIEKRALKLAAAANVTKAFDNTDVVKVGGVASTTGVGLTPDNSAKQTDDGGTLDTVDLDNTYTRVYKSKNATKTAEAKKDNIKYSGIKLTGAAAANYYLADPDGKALTGNDTAGYTMFGDGEITPFQVTKTNFKLNFRTQPIKKTYDGTTYVDGDTENPTAWKGYITDSYVTDSSNNHLFDIDVEKVNSATYRNAGNTADDKNVGQNKKVLFNLKFSDAAQNNFDFSSDFYTPDADGNQMLSDGTYNRYTKGDIEKRVLQANLAHGADIRKVYDGTKAADKSNLSILNFVEADKDKLTTTATFDKATATVDPGAAATNTRQITYTATLTGDAADNYAFDTLTGPAEKTLRATGDIERRKVYAKVTGVREKTYDATTNVLINNAPPANGEALVTFGKSADGDTDTGLVTGTNATTAVYTDADAADSANKTVQYTLKIDGTDTGGTDYADNYIVYDAEHPNTVVYNKAAGINTGLSTANNKINRAPLTLTAAPATKQYDGTKTVKNPDTLLNITGGWQGTDGGDLNRTGTGNYTATYQDANVNTKGVDYGNVKIVGTGTTKASNYYLSYDGEKLMPSSSEAYELHGAGEITKRQLTGSALNIGFKSDAIKKSYDGTADVKSPEQYVDHVRATYTDTDGAHTFDLTDYKIERADYQDKADGLKAKDVGKGKDVNFRFALNDGNFDYTNADGVTRDAAGVYHFSKNYDRDAAGVGRGEITGRRVALTLRLVQKVYDGTTEVKNGYYTKDSAGKLVEHNPNLDWKKVITLDGDGKIGGDENSGFANGEKLDFEATGEYQDANANRDPHYEGPLQLANKDVTYKMRLKDQMANKNYSFQIRVVDAAGNTLKTDTSQSLVDPSMGESHTFKGLGDIWQKQLTFSANGLHKNYDGNADVTDAVRKGLQFNGVAERDRDFFNFSDPANANADRFAGKISGRYGDRAVEGSFLNTPQNTNVYKHVKRPAGNLNGTPEARDVELKGVKDALSALQTPGSVANNYFYDGDNTVYGTGIIKPLSLSLKKTWQRNGADFSKMYDRDLLAKIDGKALDAANGNSKAFHDKLKLSVDLGTGESPIELDYTLYGDEQGDYEGYRPHYENLSGGVAHHGESDANVKNSADPSDTLDKDIVYRLKRVNGDKAWANQPEGERYKDWELSENPSGSEVRLSDAATDANTDNSAALRARITPKKVELQADSYSKIYDGTASLAAPSASAEALAKKQQELRSKLHVKDEETAKMLTDDGIDFTVDPLASQFLDKTSRAADANVLRDGEGNVPEDGKLVAYRLLKTGDAVGQENYELPAETQTDTVLGVGGITPRIVRVEFDPTDANTAIKTPDKIYDGTQYAVKDGELFKRKFRLVASAGDEGVIGGDAGDVQLNRDENIGRFATPNVQKDKGSVQVQDVTYNDGVALTNGRNKAGNYTLVSDNLKDTAKITPRTITATLKNEPIVKEYDGTAQVKDRVLRTSAGTVATTPFREGNIQLDDMNGAVNGITAPALPIWSTEDKEKGMTLTNASYDNKNVGTGKRVTYDIALASDNYALVDGAGNSLTSGDRTAQITSLQGVIERRKVFVGLGKSADKVYDGNRVVRDALDDLSFTYNGMDVESPQEGLVAEEAQKVKKALRVSGVYTDDADAAKNDSEEYKHHKVRYTFEKDETRDPILANYEITTKNGNHTIDDDKGIIRRRTLNVVPDSQATYERRGNVNYTGHIEDGSKAANGGSDLTQEVKNDLQRFNSGVFTYGPTKGSVDYDTPDWNELQGWYMKDGKKTLASGAYDKNYTLNPVPARLFVAPRTDGVDRTLRPDGQVYVHASYDEKDTFGAHRGPDASITYTGAGVNYGGMKPQQGTSTNASDAGIRQQGIGTNIGSSAGIGSAAVANGKVQGATSAANEAARAAGAQPGAAVKPQGTAGGNAALAGGTAGLGGYYSPGAQPGASVKPQGAQSGAAVKPQGTTSGNAALAGGTAGQGGYYRPSAQQGASVKPQGAQSGAAAKPQSAASAVGSAGRTGGAESVVDRGLAAAAGVSVGSSSDARTGASGSRRSADYSSSAGSYADGSSRAADRGLANALGKGVGSAGYYSGKGYSHTNDDEEEEIKKKTKKASA